VPLYRRRRTSRRAVVHRWRFQRLAPSCPACVGRVRRPQGDPFRATRQAGPDVPRAVPVSETGPYLCAQRGKLPPGEALASPMGAAFRSCAACCGGIAMPVKWTEGNAFELLENGEEFFPAVYESVAAARRSVLIETFIIFDDRVGRDLLKVLVEAAGRGVEVDVTVDGYGTADLPSAYIEELVAAGVRLHVFDPKPRRFGLRTNLFRRLHRKIVVVDSQVAFVGGINFGADHLIETGPTAKQDYAVRVRGPIVADIEADVLKLLAEGTRERGFWRRLKWRRKRP